MISELEKYNCLKKGFSSPIISEDYLLQGPGECLNLAEGQSKLPEFWYEIQTHIIAAHLFKKMRSLQQGLSL